MVRRKIWRSWPHSVVTNLGPLRAPLGKLNVRFVSAVWADIGCWITEKAEDHVRVEIVHATDNPELVASKSESVPRVSFRAVPPASSSAELEVKVVAPVNPDVVLIPVLGASGSVRHPGANSGQPTRYNIIAIGP